MNWMQKKPLQMNICLNNNKKLDICGIKKDFEETAVLSDISLNLKDREFVSILGPSGSGKSTLFNIISGLISPDTGKVMIEGEDYTGKTGRVSYMYQKDLLLPWKKIIDNVAIPLVIKGMSKEKAREKAEKYFELFGIDGFQHKYPFQLSGGMRQRAALMRTYMFSRDIILLDEPFGGLDAITRSKMHYWLMDILNTLDVSILFITHDIEEAILLSDRIYILSDRPAKIKEELDIKLPRPRNRDITTSVEFNNIKKHIIEKLD
ncbi:ABC transporter ATP-binding protein [Clostridiisalibacter paucivorans]|uniref:ABC transporter ATP-binding protein n=1 Tax=Clostridiisalibacter paucivorans TaxID=408753 RepID=UPI001FE1839D|nr:ABC transporter ATP-binding protein [Clostridiisalibacter paucivorans]